MKTDNIVVVVAGKYDLSVIESSIIIYLYHTPDALKTTSKIWGKFLKTHSNYSHFCIILRRMMIKGLIYDHKIGGGRKKAWIIVPNLKEELYQEAIKIVQKQLEEQEIAKKNEEKKEHFEQKKEHFEQKKEHFEQKKEENKVIKR